MISLTIIKKWSRVSGVLLCNSVQYHLTVTVAVRQFLLVILPRALDVFGTKCSGIRIEYISLLKNPSLHSMLFPIVT